MNNGDKIFVAGHRGLVGSAIVRTLRDKGYHNIVTRTHAQLDLINQQAVTDFFAKEQPQYVFLAAAKVGGIFANNAYRADFIYENLQIQNNVIHTSYQHAVKKLLFLGSSCIYPKRASQPMQEHSLLTSELEYTNEPYAIAKITGIKMCESYNVQYGTNFMSVMPTNLYGPNDNFDLQSSHVLPALLRKMHLAKLLSEQQYDEVIADVHVDTIAQARDYLAQFNVDEKQVEIWGSGTPKREFLYSEDMADACVFIMENVDFADLSDDSREVKNTHINIGTGKDIAIKDLACMIKNIVGFRGDLVFNTDRPDGTMQKLTDISKVSTLGWQAHTKLEAGVQKMYQWYKAHK